METDGATSSVGLAVDPRRVVILAVPGDGTLVQKSEFLLDSAQFNAHAWPRFDAVDLDGDAVVDLLMWDDVGLHLRHGYGDGTFADGDLLLASEEIRAVIGADFDADGHSDLAVCRGSELLLMYREP
jgi:hypothetical protein